MEKKLSKGSVELQNNIRTDSEEVSQFINDLNKWTTDIKEQEQKLDTGNSNNEEIISKKMEDLKLKSEKSMVEKEKTSFEVSKKIIQPNAKKAEEYKDEGNKCFKDKKYLEAIEQYSKGIKFDEGNQFIYSNRAQAYIFIGEYKKAIDDCNFALSIDPKLEKGLFRKKKALLLLKEQEEKNDELELKESEKRKQNSDVQTFPRIITPITPPVVKKTQMVQLTTKLVPDPNNAERNSSSAKKIEGKEKIAKSNLSISQNQFKSTKNKEPPADKDDFILPPIAKTASQFLMDWRNSNKNHNYEALYLKQMTEDDYLIFQDSMDYELFSEILDTLVWEFLRRGWQNEATIHMKGIMKVGRLKTLIMFLSQKDRANLRKVLMEIPDKDLLKIYDNKYDIMR